VLLKSVIFYIAITLEAFIFCFAGEYLSAKVRTLSYIPRHFFATNFLASHFLTAIYPKNLMVHIDFTVRMLLASESSQTNRLIGIQIEFKRDRLLRCTFRACVLLFQSRSIGDAAYESLWYNMTPDKCRILLFVILRSQRRLTISAGNVMDLSLEGFTTVSIYEYTP